MPNIKSAKKRVKVTKVKDARNQAARSELRTILKAEAHRLERENAPRMEADPWRMKFHLMPPTGWMNDPNGLCQFHGT